MQEVCNSKPNELEVMELPTGERDVWVREDIEETTDDDGNAVWTCDCTYLRTWQVCGTAEEYLALVDDETEAPTVEERVGDLETATDAILLAIAELYETMEA